MRLLVLFALGALLLCGQKRQIAITIDDLPRGGDGTCDVRQMEEMTRSLLEPYRVGKVPVTGFVNESRCGLSDGDLRRILGMWLEAGAELGNHTDSHPSLNKVTVEAFVEDLKKGERVTRALVRERSGELRYFRHPFLQVGLTLEKRREAEARIAALGYQIAPVTIDNSDWMFAAVYGAAVRQGNVELAEKTRKEYLRYLEGLLEFFEKRSVEVLGREVAQVLLLHANAMNARNGVEMLEMFARRGYEVVPLAVALRDGAYREADTYVGAWGLSWLHHWAATKGMKEVKEPGEPEWVQEAFRKMTAK